MEGKYKKMKSETFCMDNLDFLRNCQDKKYDVAVVDPEYRDENQPDIGNRAKGGFKDWKGAPKAEFFYHLFRVSREQIIFGGNYFTTILNYTEYQKTGNLDDIRPFLDSNNNWYIWDKKMARGLHYSMCEMAWVSFRKNTQIFRFRSNAESWHETGKPIELYSDLFNCYLKPMREELVKSCIEEGRRISILDTNLGSGKSRMAALALGYDFTGIEINPKYFDKQEKDFTLYYEKNKMFLPSLELDSEKFSLDDL